jgi:hypothetical protein
LVLDDRRLLHASAAQKQDFVSPTLHLFNARIPPINRISSHSLTTLALVELVSAATVRRHWPWSLHRTRHLKHDPNQRLALIQTSLLVATRKIVSTLDFPSTASSLRMSATDMAPVASRTRQGCERMSRESMVYCNLDQGTASPILGTEGRRFNIAPRLALAMISYMIWHFHILVSSPSDSRVLWRRLGTSLLSPTHSCLFGSACSITLKHILPLSLGLLTSRILYEITVRQ